MFGFMKKKENEVKKMEKNIKNIGKDYNNLNTSLLTCTEQMLAQARK